MASRSSALAIVAVIVWTGVSRGQSTSITGPAYYPNGPLGPALAIPPLYAAVGRGDVREVKLLVENGADPNKRIQTGWAPVHQAIYTTDEILRLLLNHGADPNLPIGPDAKGYSNKCTPLYLAVYLRKREMVQTLLYFGADPVRVNSSGKSVIDVAHETKDSSIISLIEAARKDR